MTSIRPITQADIPAIAFLAHEFTAHENALGIEGVFSLTEERLLCDGFGEAPAFTGFIASDGGEAVGYLLCAPNYDGAIGRRTLEIIDIFVRAESRGKRIGHSLMSAARSHCLTIGAAELVWTVSARNLDAIRFYESLGAQKHDLIVMTLDPAAD